MRLLLVAAATLAIAAPTALYAQGTPDTIFVGSTPQRGYIVSIAPDKVTINQTGVQRTFDVKEISRITFGNEDLEVRSVRNAALELRYADAVDAAEKVDFDSIESVPIQQEVLFYRAASMVKLALAGEGDKATAANAMLKFIGESSKSWHYFEAIELYGDLLMSLGDTERASKVYAQLENAPWNEEKMSGKTGVANALVAEGLKSKDKSKFQTAKAKYTEVTQMKSESAEGDQQRLYASVGIATCQANLGQPDEGIKAINAIIARRESTDTELFGRAYNALGACHLAKGNLQDALLAYLHTDILFYGNPDVHGEALYNLANLWDQLKKPDRGREARTLLRSRYQGTRWALKAAAP